MTPAWEFLADVHSDVESKQHAQCSSSGQDQSRGPMSTGYGRQKIN